MKIRTLIYIVILLLTVNVAAICTIVYNRVASPRPEMRMPFGGPDGPPPGEMPQLSAEERELMEKSRRQVDSVITPIIAKIDNFRRDLIEELKNDNPDTTKAYQLIAEIGVLQSAIQKHMVSQILNDRSSLRPEQRKRLLKMIEERTRWQERGRLGGRRLERGF